MFFLFLPLVQEVFVEVYPKLSSCSEALRLGSPGRDMEEWTSGDDGWVKPWGISKEYDIISFKNC